MLSVRADLDTSIVQSINYNLINILRKQVDRMMLIACRGYN